MRRLQGSTLLRLMQERIGPLDTWRIQLSKEEEKPKAETWRIREDVVCKVLSEFENAEALSMTGEWEERWLDRFTRSQGC